jgi:serine/threonine protein phosphatase 1
MKYFVVSDVHSFYDAMMNALNKQGFDPENKEHKLIVCGDLFDRGDDTVKVYEFVRSLAEQDRLFYIYGNHEALLFECIHDIARGHMKEYHIKNGTFKTICDFTGLNKYDLYMGQYGPLNMEEFKAKIIPLMDFIDKYAVDVAEIGKYIFVHGWIPCDPDKGIVPDNWYTGEADWEGARWINGMHAWAKGAKLPGRTIVCGHWHCSWGHSHINLDRKEFPQKDREGWEKSFEPFVEEGIIALDACTAYSGICNCFVLET